MGTPLKSISVSGFRSIARLDNFELRDVNLLIGANGSGKSNFVGLFQFLRELIRQNLGVYCARMGGADSFLFLGRRQTPELSVGLRFGVNGYDFTLVPNTEDQFIFGREATYFEGSYSKGPWTLGSGHGEAKIASARSERGVYTGKGISAHVWDALSSWTLYHFDNTGPEAPPRLPGELNDNERLREDGGNLAAYLFLLSQRSAAEYAQIRNAIRQVAPFFDDFRLRPDPLNPERIRLEWSQPGSDYRFRAIHLSDGTLRFICLATALLDPQRPATVLFDEPELGLHPAALAVLGAMFRTKRNERDTRQLIATTQSAPFLAHFEPEEVIVVERDENSASTFRRLEPEPLKAWLGEYTLGDLWQMNLLGGRPSPEAPVPAQAQQGE